MLICKVNVYLYISVYTIQILLMLLLWLWHFHVSLFMSVSKVLPMVLVCSRGSWVKTGCEPMDGRPVPALFTAQTLNWYQVPSSSPNTGYWHVFWICVLHRTHWPWLRSHLRKNKRHRGRSWVSLTPPTPPPALCCVNIKNQLWNTLICTATHLKFYKMLPPEENKKWKEIVLLTISGC